jgi:hypothetical protein
MCPVVDSGCGKMVADCLRSEDEQCYHPSLRAEAMRHPARRIKPPSWMAMRHVYIPTCFL